MKFLLQGVGIEHKFPWHAEKCKVIRVGRKRLNFYACRAEMRAACCGCAAPAGDGRYDGCSGRAHGNFRGSNQTFSPGILSIEERFLTSFGTTTFIFGMTKTACCLYSVSPRTQLE